jgi:uncharacterized Zn finger protein
MKDHRFVRFLGNEVERVGEEMEDIADELASEYERGEHADEREVNTALRERINRELPRRIGEGLDGKEKDGVEFYARVLSSQKEGSEESNVGADIGIVFRAELPDYTVSKGVLIQSKTYQSWQQKDRYNTSGLETEVNYSGTTNRDTSRLGR